MNHLYAHFPFCASRCGYCDFFSQAGGLERAPEYVRALKSELRLTVDGGVSGAAGGERNLREPGGGGLVSGGGLETVYLGGGTPTYVGAELIGEFLEAALALAREDAEVTVEANPSTVTGKLAESLAEAGVNRVSLGVQSFNERLRRNLGRAGAADAAALALRVLRAAGFENIGLDLMFSIPKQSVTDLERDLDMALELEPDHLSCYELTVKEGSGFEHRWRRVLVDAAENGRVFYETVVDRLERAGYRWYETSNFALPGKECRHNLAYWAGRDFVGLGAGAWSTVGGRRWRNVEDVETYIGACGRGDFSNDAGGSGNIGAAHIRAARSAAHISAASSTARKYETIDEQQRQCERLLLGLRRDCGVERSRVEAVIDAAQENILHRNGFLVNEGGRICLTRPGRFVANEVCARLLQEWGAKRAPMGRQASAMRAPDPYA